MGNGQCARARSRALKVLAGVVVYECVTARTCINMLNEGLQIEILEGETEIPVFPLLRVDTHLRDV